MIWTAILIAIPVVLLLWAMTVYNRLVIYKNEVKNAHAQIDVQLKRRYDLIPNLVETAKKYLSHERETLEAVISARSQANQARQQLSARPANAQAIRDMTSAEKNVQLSLGQLFALNERYPELQADRSLQELRESLTSTENRVGFARQAYNDAILSFNNAAMQFPDLIIARLFGYGELPTLQATQSDLERQAPKIQL